MTGDRQKVHAIEHHFAGLGADYDESAFATAGEQWVGERELDAVRCALPSPSGDSRVLDAGCGNGRISALLAGELGHRVTALDPVPEMLRTAADRVPGLTTVQARLGDPLPFPSATFDAVVAMRVLKWVPGWRAALSEIARVLRPGGRVVLEVTNRNSLARLGYRNAPITMLTGAEIRDAGTAAGIWWYDTYSGSHVPYKVWNQARRPGAVLVARRLQRACDRVLGATGARSFTIVGMREIVIASGR